MTTRMLPSYDDDDNVGYLQERQSKDTKRKTWQAKALENAKKAPKAFLELLHDVLVNTILTLDLRNKKIKLT